MSLPLLKSSCVPVLAAGLATKEGRGRGVATTRRHESRLLASTSLIAAPAQSHVPRRSRRKLRTLDDRSFSLVRPPYGGLSGKVVEGGGIRICQLEFIKLVCSSYN